MSRLQQLHGFLAERLAAVLKEVLKEVLVVVEDTVTEYREEAARARRESDSLREQLRDFLLLEAGTEWLRSTRSSLGLVSPEPQTCDQDPGPRSEEPDQTLNQTLSQTLNQSRPPQTSDPAQSVQSDPGPGVLPEDTKPPESWDLVLKPDPEEGLPSCSALNAPPPSLPKVHVEVPARVQEPRVQESRIQESRVPEPQDQEHRVQEPRVQEHRVQEPRVQEPQDQEPRVPDPDLIKSEPEEYKVSEPEGHTEAPRDQPGVRTRTVVVRADGNRKWSEETGGGAAAAGPPAVQRCPRCGEAFAAAAALRLHLEQKKKTYGCDWCCKSFAQSADLRRHLRTHTGERPHRCTFCSKSFSQRGNLRRHLRIHTGERPYSCPFCCRSFSDGDTMKKHKRTHLGDKPQRCSRCTKTFAGASGLQIHLKRDLCFMASA